MNAELLIFQAELAPGDAAATELLQRALDTADAQGSVANSLRAAAALVARTGAEPAVADLARATLALLEGRGEYPAQDGWMGQRLEVLRQALTSSKAVAPL